jgi:hypothetical protein
MRARLLVAILAVAVLVVVAVTWATTRDDPAARGRAAVTDAWQYEQGRCEASAKILGYRHGDYIGTPGKCLYTP